MSEPLDGAPEIDIAVCVPLAEIKTDVAVTGDDTMVDLTVSPGEIQSDKAVSVTSTAVAVWSGTATSSHVPLLFATAHDFSVTVDVIGKKRLRTDSVAVPPSSVIVL